MRCPVNSVFPEDRLKEFLNFVNSPNEAYGILAVTDHIDDEKPLCVRFNENNEILEFSDSQNGFKWVTGGIYYFSEDIVEDVKSIIDGGILHLRNFLKALLNDNKKLIGFPFCKIFDIDHVNDIRSAEEFLRSVENK